MLKRGRLTLQIIDGLGGCAVVACLAGLAWVTVVRSGQTSADIGELASLIQTAKRDVIKLNAARRRQRAILQSRQAELAETGQLPIEAPIEEYFQTLSSMVSRHRLRVVRHNPLPSRQYPGMLEQRFAYEVTGSMPDLVAFLQSIERTDFWADVSYLKISRGDLAQRVADNSRSAVLTISFFSALSPDDDSVEEGA